MTTADVVETLESLLRAPDALFTVDEIADAARLSGGVLRGWLTRGGVVLDERLDHISIGGGRTRPNRLHWRTAVELLLAVKLNEYGFGLVNGDAAEVAHDAAKGLKVNDLESLAGGRVIVIRRARIALRRIVNVDVIQRPEIAEVVRRHNLAAGMMGVGVIVLDPLGLGNVLWRILKARADV